MRCRHLAILMLAVAGCDPAASYTPSYSWAADVRETQELVVMHISTRDGAISGTGALASLTNVGSEPLDVSGTQIGDSVSVTFHRDIGAPFTFDGRYVATGIAGILHGAHFDSVSTTFRRR